MVRPGRGPTLPDCLAQVMVVCPSACIAPFCNGMTLRTIGKLKTLPLLFHNVTSDGAHTRFPCLFKKCGAGYSPLQLFGGSFAA